MEKRVLNIKLSPKQMDAFRVLSSEESVELLFGGGKGGAKTCLGVRWAYAWVKWLINFFGLKPSAHPPVLGWIGRKQGVDFSTTTLNTWKRDLPSDGYELREQKKLIIVDRCASIQYGGLDDQETIQKFNSAEYAFAWIDQPDECTQQDVGMIRAALRLKLNGKEPPYKLLLTPNPVLSEDPDLQWLRREFIESPSENRKFIKALYKDNPYLPLSYGKTLEDAYGFNPALLKAYRDGDWNQTGLSLVVIPRKSVESNIDNDLHHWPETRRLTVADVAGEGDDETVIYDMVNAKIVDKEIYSHVQLMDTCGRIIAHVKTNRSRLICVDKVGEGAGILSRLMEVYGEDSKVKVIGFDGRVQAPQGLDHETYANYKTYAWFRASRKIFQEVRANVPREPVLISQLSSMTYHFTSGGKYILDAKDVIKSKLKKSPDRADAYIMGLDALQYCDPEKEEDEPYIRRSSVEKSGWHKGAYVPQTIFA